MPNGDRIEGTFQGQWNDGLKINGMYYKGNGPEDNSTSMLSERYEHHFEHLLYLFEIVMTEWTIPQLHKLLN